MEIVKRGIFETSTLVADGEVKFAGRVPSRMPLLPNEIHYLSLQ